MRVPVVTRQDDQGVQGGALRSPRPARRRASPAVATRTYKAELAVGMTPEALERVRGVEDWMTSVLPLYRFIIIIYKFYKILFCSFLGPYINRGVEDWMTSVLPLYYFEWWW